MRDPIVRTYDPKKVIVAFGALVMTGFAPGTFVNVARSNDLFEKNRGSDGTIDRVNKNADDFAISLTLKQTSLTNDALSIIMNLDKENNAGIFPFTVKDLGGLSFFFASQAWIAKDPDDEYSDAFNNRVWRFDTGPAKKFTGGNIIALT